MTKKKTVDGRRWTVDGRRLTVDGLASAVNGQPSLAKAAVGKPSTVHRPPSTANIAIFASGGGSNACKIIEHFENLTSGCVGLVVSNKADAGVLDIAAQHHIPTQIIGREMFYESEAILDILKQHDIEFVVLAGFLWLVPEYLVRAFPRKIVNIHPALLPKYGGKGMYGMNVHKAVKAAGEGESGITIHYVNDHYDDGDIIFQASCPILPEDSAEIIAKKVLELEHRHFPKVIESIIF